MLLNCVQLNYLPLILQRILSTVIWALFSFHDVLIFLRFKLGWAEKFLLWNERNCISLFLRLKYDPFVYKFIFCLCMWWYVNAYIYKTNTDELNFKFKILMKMLLNILLISELTFSELIFRGFYKKRVFLRNFVFRNGNEMKFQFLLRTCKIALLNCLLLRFFIYCILLE